jgi:hypothetical protein
VGNKKTLPTPQPKDVTSNGSHTQRKVPKIVNFINFSLSIAMVNGKW